MRHLALLPILAAAIPGCMTSHQDEATQLASMASPELISGYGPSPNTSVELHCRPPGEDSDQVVAVTQSAATNQLNSPVDIYKWSFFESIPAPCWTQVGPGLSGANVWAVFAGLQTQRIDDIACALEMQSWADVGNCSSDAKWVRLVAPNGVGSGTNPLVGAPPLEVVAGGLSFAEGPMWEPENGRLLFTDIETDTIYSVVPGGNATPLPIGAGTHTNGQAKWLEGPVVRCEHANQRVVLRSAGGVVSVLADTYAGEPFNSPNDAAVSLNGTIYFTDPTYGSNPAWGGATPTLGFQGVYRVARDEAPVLEASWNNRQPNGIAFSPDYSTLYVTDTQAGEVLSFSVAEDGSLGTEQHFAWVGGADGMAVDVDGNLFVTGSAGVSVLAPNGSSWGTVPLSQATNCTFGGSDRSTLFITTRTTVYSLDLSVPGMPPMY